jgi:hypothetical protein
MDGDARPFIILRSSLIVHRSPIAGRLAAAMDWPTRRLFSSGS